MENLPTAEEFLDNRTENSKGLVDNEIYIPFDGAIKIMIEFAKLHVEAALKAASEATLLYDFKKEITNSYPLENIK